MYYNSRGLRGPQGPQGTVAVADNAQALAGTDNTTAITPLLAHVVADQYTNYIQTPVAMRMWIEADANGVVALGNIGITPEGGMAVRLINKTGTASVKGTLVSAASTADGGFILQANEYDMLGVCYSDGVADGGACWVVVHGIAQVLLEDSTAATRGNWVHAAATDGRADATLTQPSGAGFTEAAEHFKEVGHCIETVTSGTNKLAKVVLHFL